MNTSIDINQLLQKPVAMMTGEELFLLLSKGIESNNTNMAQSVSRGNYYGIEGIARIFGCSVPTANRIKKSGIIDKAIIQIGRKIVIDADLALALAKEAGCIQLNGK